MRVGGVSNVSVQNRIVANRMLLLSAPNGHIVLYVPEHQFEQRQPDAYGPLRTRH
jgi:hypothetical protein